MDFSLPALPLLLRQLHLDLRVNESPSLGTPPNRVVPPDVPYRAAGARGEKVKVLACLPSDRRHCGARLHLDLGMNKEPRLPHRNAPLVLVMHELKDVGLVFEPKANRARLAKA
jgi:hypothetical protein